MGMEGGAGVGADGGGQHSDSTTAATSQAREHDGSEGADTWQGKVKRWGRRGMVRSVDVRSIDCVSGELCQVSGGQSLQRTGL